MNETVQIKTPWLASKDPEVPSTLNLSLIHILSENCFFTTKEADTSLR